MTLLVARREWFAAAPARPSAPKPERVAEWRSYARSGHLMGASGAPLEIVVFSDFQCPACRALAVDLKALRAEFPNDVAVRYRHAPLPSHPWALAAARASECAARQGRFAELHDALFVDQPAIGLAPWTRFASSAGVPDTTAFARCAASSGADPVIGADTLDARRLGVRATPTLLIRDLKLVGAPPMDTLRSLVQRAIRENGR